MTKEELLNMELHEMVKINSSTYVLRVIGGFIYKHYMLSLIEDEHKHYTLICTTFVSELTENFQTVNDSNIKKQTSTTITVGSSSKS